MKRSSWSEILISIIVKSCILNWSRYLKHDIYKYLLNLNRYLILFYKQQQINRWSFGNGHDNSCVFIKVCDLTSREHACSLKPLDKLTYLFSTAGFSKYLWQHLVFLNACDNRWFCKCLLCNYCALALGLLGEGNPCTLHLESPWSQTCTNWHIQFFFLMYLSNWQILVLNLSWSWVGGGAEP